MKKHEHIIIICTIIAAILLGAGASYFTFGRLHASDTARYESYDGYLPQDLAVTNITPDFQDFLQAQADIAYMPSTKYPPSEPEVSTPQTLHKYVVTSQDGFIVVLYAGCNKNGTVHTITNTPVAPLPQEEQDRLAAGINIYTEDALFRILEDFGS